MKRGDELRSGVLQMVKVYVATKRTISVGDKMAGRHGNKGVIAKILPQDIAKRNAGGIHLRHRAIADFAHDGIGCIDQIRVKKLRAVRQQNHISLLLPLGCAAGYDKHQVRMGHELLHKRILTRNAAHGEHHHLSIGFTGDTPPRPRHTGAGTSPTRRTTTRAGAGLRQHR